MFFTSRWRETSRYRSLPMPRISRAEVSDAQATAAVCLREHTCSSESITLPDGVTILLDVSGWHHSENQVWCGCVEGGG